MHNEQIQFIFAVRNTLPYYFNRVSVLEVGSYNVNGSIKPIFFLPSRYVGIDLIEGPGVDVVCRGEDYKGGEPFDTVISTECFEHAPQFLDIFKNMIANCRDDGVVLFTCATEGRPEHGTSRTSAYDSPGTVKTGSEHYRNVVAADFPKDLLESAFHDHCFFINDITHDLYFLGIRPSDPLAAEIFAVVAQKSGARIAE